MTLVGWLLVATAAVTAAPQVRQPIGKWVVEYSEDSCVLSHQFGAGEAEVTIGWRAVPLEESIELLVRQPDKASVFADKGRAVIELANGRSSNAFFQSYSTEVPHQRMTRFRIDAGFFDALVLNPMVMTVSPEKLSAFAVSMPAPKAAFAALDTCNRDTMKHWGVDPDQQALVVTRAKPKTDAERWITSADYPRDARRAGKGGVSTILYRVRIDGSVSDCRVVVTSGLSTLDDAACGALMRRARYLPARDAAGRPTEAQISRRIFWILLPW